MSEYVKIRKQILIDIADAIRLQKETTNLYKPSEFASIIRKFLCLPSAEAVSENLTGWSLSAASDGVLPYVHKSTAFTAISSISLFSSASGILIEDDVSVE